MSEEEKKKKGERIYVTISGWVSEWETDSPHFWRKWKPMNTPSIRGQLVYEYVKENKTP